MIRSTLFIVWFLVSFVLRLSSRVSFVIGIFALLISGFSMMIDHQGFALRMTTYSFGFFVIGLVSYILELKGYEKK